jgi:uncharacterized protein YidB (DUF937 family)
MLDNLINLVKEHAGDAIVKNDAIPNEHNEAAIITTANSILDTLKSQATSGNLGGIMEMFKNNGTSNSLSSSISNNVIGEFTKKFGMDSAPASSIASSLIPKVMESFTKKTNDPNDSSFNLQDVVKNIGGDAGGMLGGLGKLLN